MTSVENLAVARTVLSALQRGDWADLEAHPGLAETRQRQPLLRAAFPDLQVTIEEELADGDLVALRVLMQGTHLGPFMGVPPTGKTVTYQVLVMDRIIDGRIVQHWATPDWLSILGPLGLIPLPAA